MPQEWMAYTKDDGVTRAILVEKTPYLSFLGLTGTPWAALAFQAVRTNLSGSPDELEEAVQPRTMQLSTVLGVVTLVSPVAFSAARTTATEALVASVFAGDATEIEDAFNGAAAIDVVRTVGEIDGAPGADA